MAAGDNLHPAFVRTAAPAPAMFATAGGIKAPRSQASIWTAVILHAIAIALIAYFVLHQVVKVIPQQPQVATVVAPPPPLPPPMPVLPKQKAMGGGGGQHDIAPVSKGRLPKFSQEPPILPPKAPPTLAPKLAVQPTIDVQQNIKVANNDMPNFGAPNSNLPGVSMGNGNGAGIGSGSGNGFGAGSGGNTGGGVRQVGGSVRPPSVIYQVDPEFSEEARKAKFSGNVQVALIVDEHGNPSHVRVERGVGMGLDEKAVEAVRQYKFKPAMENGRPVPVEIYVEVNFQIF